MWAMLAPTSGHAGRHLAHGREGRHTTRVRRNNAFDLLRLFAASIVVVIHGMTYFHTNLLWGVPELFDGVGMFFVLSGLLVYRSGESIYRRTGGFRQFFLNRYLRIAPGIYTFALIAPLVLVAVGGITFASLIDPQIVLWLGSAALLVPDYHPAIWAHVGFGVINGQLYTIPAEISFYLIVPLLVLAARRFGPRTMIVGLVAVAVVLPAAGDALGPLVHNVFHHLFIERAGYFAAGIFWAYYWERIGPRVWLFWASLVAWMAVAYVGLHTTGLESLFPLFTAIPMSYVLVYIGYQAPRALARVTEVVGDLSFGTYIWHTTVINVFLFLGLSGPQYIPAVLVIAWAVAAVSWRLVEKPALKLKRVSIHPMGGRTAVIRAPRETTPEPVVDSAGP